MMDVIDPNMIKYKKNKKVKVNVVRSTLSTKTVRLSEESWEKLAHMAVDRRTTIHELVRQAIKDLFEKRGEVE